MPSALRLYGLRSHQRQPKKERYRSEYLMKFVLEAARLFLSSHIWEIPWAGGFLGKMSGSCLRHYYTGNGSFFTTFYYYYWETIGELVWVDFLWGSWLRRRSVQIEPGKAACSFVFCFLFRNLLQFLPSGRHSVWICPVWFFFSLLWRTREPFVLLDISLSVWEKKTTVWLLSCAFVFIFCFYFAKHMGVALGGRESHIWTMRSGFAGRVFLRDFSRAFSIHIWSRPFSVLLQIFMGNFGGVGTADRRDPGNFTWRMCGLDTAAWKPTGREYTNVKQINYLPTWWLCLFPDWEKSYPAPKWVMQ